MDAKLNHSDLSALLAKQTGMSVAKAETFTKIFFDIIIEGLAKDNLVKINGFGTFKITDVASRGSVDVNTGEKIEIKGHKKLTFLPADTLKEKVNQPFAMFEPVEVDDSYVDDGEEENDSVTNETAVVAEEGIPTTEQQETEAPAVEEVAHAAGEPTEETEIVPIEEELVTKVEGAIETASEVETTLAPAEIAAKEEIVIEESATTTSATTNENEKKAKKKSAWPYIILILLIVSAVAEYWLIELQPAKHAMEEPTQIAVVETKDEPVSQPVEEIVEEPVIEELIAEEPYKFVMVDALAAMPTKSITLGDTLHYSMSGDIATHVVAENETLARIALIHYGDRKLWPYIVHYNNLDKPNALCKGMELRIPRLLPKEQ